MVTGAGAAVRDPLLEQRASFPAMAAAPSHHAGAINGSEKPIKGNPTATHRAGSAHLDSHRRAEGLGL